VFTTPQLNVTNLLLGAGERKRRGRICDAARGVRGRAGAGLGFDSYLLKSLVIAAVGRCIWEWRSPIHRCGGALVGAEAPGPEAGRGVGAMSVDGAVFLFAPWLDKR